MFRPCCSSIPTKVWVFFFLACFPCPELDASRPIRRRLFETNPCVDFSSPLPLTGQFPPPPPFSPSYLPPNPPPLPCVILLKHSCSCLTWLRHAPTLCFYFFFAPRTMQSHAKFSNPCPETPRPPPTGGFNEVFFMAPTAKHPPLGGAFFGNSETNHPQVASVSCPSQQTQNTRVSA